MPLTPGFEEQLYNLRVGCVGSGADRHERPHKPLLLLTILDLIATGKARPNRVPWSPELRARFQEYFAIVRAKDDAFSPELPFYHLNGELSWQPVRQASDGAIRPLEGAPNAGDANAGTVWGSFGEDVSDYFSAPDSRARMRAILVARYFPHHRAALQALFGDPAPGAIHEAPQSASVREDPDREPEPEPGRSAAFIRIVREAYDFQCAACGLRIRLESDLTFIDAAHIIPFKTSFNDHPTNGIALCKNHHWAMDRELLAPTTSFTWKVASRLVARRSKGEADLLQLAGEPILLPRDAAYHPHLDGLRWREERVR